MLAMANRLACCCLCTNSFWHIIVNNIKFQPVRGAWVSHTKSLAKWWQDIMPSGYNCIRLLLFSWIPFYCHCYPTIRPSCETFWYEQYYYCYYTAVHWRSWLKTKSTTVKNHRGVEIIDCIIEKNVGRQWPGGLCSSGGDAKVVRIGAPSPIQYPT